MFQETRRQQGCRYVSEPWFRKGYLYPSQQLPVDITKDKWHYEMDYEPLSIWKKVKQPALFLFAEVDEWVPVERGMKNQESATSHLKNVTFKRIKGTKHLMSVSSDENVLDISREYLDILLDWLTTRFTS